MIAILPAPETAPSNATQYPNKEVIRHYHVVGLNSEGRLVDFVDCRLYMGRSPAASVVYAALWVRYSTYTSGRGQAGGYGYHKGSAAVAAAIESADIRLEREDGKRADISGVGDDAIREAFTAIARACGAQGNILIVS